MTVMSGPPGSGKTVLLRSWTGTQAWPSTWPGYRSGATNSVRGVHAGCVTGKVVRAHPHESGRVAVHFEQSAYVACGVRSGWSS